jgi:hypothetical protein
MAAIMQSGSFRSEVAPLLNVVFDGVYEQRTDEWKPVFTEIIGTPRAYHEEPVLYGLNSAPLIPDGMPVTYQSGGELFVKRYQYNVYGTAFAMTKVLVEDGGHIQLAKIYAEQMAQSLIETKEIKAANVLNNAFNNAYVGGDGVSLINTNHPTPNGGYSNQLTTAAALSQTSLESLLTQIRSIVDSNGKHINLQAKCLVVAPANLFQAETILNSVLRSGTANNDLNTIKSMGLVPGGQANMSRLTSPVAWFVTTNAPKGLQVVTRRGVEKSMEGDFETDSMRYKITERYDVSWTNPLGIFGTSGIAA